MEKLGTNVRHTLRVRSVFTVKQKKICPTDYGSCMLSD
jgi:hypothetical protein